MWFWTFSFPGEYPRSTCASGTWHKSNGLSGWKLPMTSTCWKRLEFKKIVIVSESVRWQANYVWLRSTVHLYSHTSVSLFASKDDPRHDQPPSCPADATVDDGERLGWVVEIGIKAIDDNDFLEVDAVDHPETETEGGGPAESNKVLKATEDLQTF